MLSTWNVKLNKMWTRFIVFLNKYTVKSNPWSKRAHVTEFFVFVGGKKKNGMPLKSKAPWNNPVFPIINCLTKRLQSWNITTLYL